MPEMIYIVQGDTGEYSDYTSWFVCAYRDEAMAREHARLAQSAAPSGDAGGHERAGAKNPYDSNMTVDYTGVEYCVIPLEVRGAVPSICEVSA